MSAAYRDFRQACLAHFLAQFARQGSDMALIAVPSLKALARRPGKLVPLERMGRDMRSRGTVNEDNAVIWQGGGASELWVQPNLGAADQRMSMAAAAAVFGRDDPDFAEIARRERQRFVGYRTAWRYFCRQVGGCEPDDGDGYNIDHMFNNARAELAGLSHVRLLPVWGDTNQDIGRTIEKIATARARLGRPPPRGAGPDEIGLPATVIAVAKAVGLGSVYLADGPEALVSQFMWLIEEHTGGKVALTERFVHQLLDTLLEYRGVG